MKSHSDIKALTDGMVEIDVSLRRARKQLVDAEWTGDEEAENALRREIERLERQKELGQTHDVPW
jgi:hypothetical protein